LKEDVDLLTTDNLGKALEIQALLAKHGIVVARAVDGTKSVLKLKAKNCTTAAGKCTTEKRDMAIMLIVESGLYDQNVGLEVFDKGDFTSTKEDTYTITATLGDFTAECVVTVEAPATGVKSPSITNGEPQKILRNGHIVIQNGDKTYSAQGQEL
jgi:hypothetical protein